MRPERPVEIRQVVEPPAISDFGDVQRPLVRIAQRIAASPKPVFEQPMTERLADLPETRMQGPDRDAKMVGGLLGRQIGIMEILPAKGEQCLDLQLRLQPP